MTNNEYIQSLLRDADDILNEVSVGTVLKGSFVALMFIGGIGAMIEDKINEKKNIALKKEREELEARQKASSLENLKIYSEYIKGSKKNIKISSRDDLIDLLVKDIKSCCNIANSNNKIKEKIKNSLDDDINNGIKKELKDAGFKNIKDAPDKLLKQTTNEWENFYKVKSISVSYICDEYVEVINGTQSASACLYWLLDDIITALKHKYGRLLKEYNIDLNSGDGDEGCIFFDE